MKYFTSSFVLGLLLALSAGPAQAQEDEGVGALLLEGALSASVSLDEVDFARLPSGKVVRIGPDGARYLTADEVSSFDPNLPQYGGEDGLSLSALTMAEREALKQELRQSLGQLLTAYDDGSISGDDTIAIVKFLLDLDLGWDETYRDQVANDFNISPLVEPAVDSDGNTTGGGSDGSVPITGGNNPLEQGPQNTDPADLPPSNEPPPAPTPPTTTTPINNTNNYFAPGS